MALFLSLVENHPYLTALAHGWEMGKWGNAKGVTDSGGRKIAHSPRILWLLSILVGISALIGGILLTGQPKPTSTQATEIEKILDVQASVPFRILIPAYLPGQLDREGVDVDVAPNGPGGQPTVQLTYRTRKGATLSVRQWVPVDRDMEVLASSRPVQTKWGRGWMLSQGQDLFTLWVDVGPVRTSIYTTRLDVIKAEEVMAIANSLEPVSDGRQISSVADTAKISDVPPLHSAEQQATNSANSPEASPLAELPENVVTTAKWGDGAELLGVSFAADGAFINVRFKLPPRKARLLTQGQVYVVHEATGITYNEIPVTPEVGPLISRPKRVGQSGYVMLKNAPQRIPEGSVVTVVLGSYRREHVLVQ